MGSGGYAVLLYTMSCSETGSWVDAYEPLVSGSDCHPSFKPHALTGLHLGYDCLLSDPPLPIPQLVSVDTKPPLLLAALSSGLGDGSSDPGPRLDLG